MKTAYIFVCVIFMATLVCKSETRGGRSGGRSVGRSSGSGKGFFGGSSRRRSSSSASKTSHSDSSSNTGGLLGGLIRSTPYHYSPSYVGSAPYSHYSRKSHHNSYSEDKDQEQLSFNNDISSPKAYEDISNKDESQFAVGYAVSKALSNDFFSIFSMVHDISKYQKEREKMNFVPQISTTPTTSSSFALPTASTSTTPATTTTTDVTKFQPSDQFDPSLNYFRFVENLYRIAPWERGEYKNEYFATPRFSDFNLYQPGEV